MNIVALCVTTTETAVTLYQLFCVGVILGVSTLKDRNRLSVAECNIDVFHSISNI